MPLPVRVIPPRSDIKEVLSNNQVKNILEKTAVSNMVGLLQQLNVLSQHASEVFTELLDDTLKSSQRIQKVKGRIRDINNKIQPIEDLYLSAPPNFFYDNPYTDQQWRREDMMRGFLFSRDEAPKSINKRRSILDIPPDLSALDKFTNDGRPCGSKYSDTDFFMNEWIEEQKVKLEEEKKKRKLRKEQRRKNRKVKRKKKQKIMKVKKKKYNKYGEEFKGEEQKEDEYVETIDYDIDGRDLMQERLGNNKKSKKSKKNSKQQQPSTQTRRSPSPQPQKQQIQQQRQPSPQPQQRQPSPQPQIKQQPKQNGRPPINPMQNGGPPKPPTNPMQNNNNSNVPPPNPIQGGPPPNPIQKTSYVPDDDDNGPNVPPPNPMQQGQGGPPPPNPMQNSHQTQPSYMGGPPKVQPSHVPTQTQDVSSLGPMTPQMRIMLSMQKAQEQQEREEQQRKLKEQEYEKQKQKANMMVGMKSTNLLAGIKSGVKLKKIDPNKIQRAKPKDTRSLLMQSLQKGAKLKKVNREEINKNKQKDDEPQEGGIFEILKRRQLIADSSSEDSASSWGSEED